MHFAKREFVLHQKQVWNRIKTSFDASQKPKLVRRYPKKKKKFNNKLFFQLAKILPNNIILFNSHAIS